MIKISRGIPPPPEKIPVLKKEPEKKEVKKPEAQAKANALPFNQLNKGDSFFVAGKNKPQLLQEANLWSKKNGGGNRKYVVHSEKGGVRIWRTK